jgi:hypothetical protein
MFCFYTIFFVLGLLLKSLKHLSMYNNETLLSNVFIGNKTVILQQKLDNTRVILGIVDVNSYG